MYTTRSFVRGILACGLVAILSGYGLAAERPGNETTIIIAEPSQSGMTGQESGRSGMDDQMVLRRTSTLIGKPLRNVQGEKVGTIHDLVLTEDLDSISYAAVSTGGLFGLGRQLHAVPWSSIQLGTNGALVAPLNKRELEQARGFSETYWPTQGNPRWAGRPGERTEEVTYGTQTALDRENVQNRRVSRIKGTMVKEPHGRTVGKVRELAVAMDSGDVLYTIVSYGGLFGLGQRYSAVPADAIIFQPERRIARLEVDQQVLQANSFTPGRFPALADPVYAQRLHESYGVETGPDWVVLGFVAPEEPPTTAMPERPAPAPTEAQLSGTFDADRITTLEGTVMELGKSESATMDRDILWLRVRTSDGQTVLVNAGPRDYIGKQDFYVVKGDRINLNGSHVQATAGARVFLPTRITHESNVLQLRDSNGNALWEEQAVGPERRPDVTGPVLPEDQAEYEAESQPPADESARE